MFQSADSAPSSTVLGAPVIGAIVHRSSPLSPTNWHKISPFPSFTKKEPSPQYRLVLVPPSELVLRSRSHRLTQFQRISGDVMMLYCSSVFSYLFPYTVPGHLKPHLIFFFFFFLQIYDLLIGKILQMFWECFAVVWFHSQTCS